MVVYHLLLTHMAYFLVQACAIVLYFSLFFKYILAMDGIKASSRLGSHSIELMDNNTLDVVSAGDHWDLRTSRQIFPLLLILGWYIRVVK